MADGSERERLPRVLGVDFGEQRIGLAVSEGRLAVPLTILEHEGRAADIERVAGIASVQGATAIVVGLPLLFSGEEGEQARRSRRFGEALARKVGVPVVYHDERLSTHDAREAAASTSRSRAKTKQRIDDRAAAIILQSYIDSLDRAS